MTHFGLELISSILPYHGNFLIHSPFYLSRLGLFHVLIDPEEIMKRKKSRSFFGTHNIDFVTWFIPKLAGLFRLAFQI